MVRDCFSRPTVLLAAVEEVQHGLPRIMVLAGRQTPFFLDSVNTRSSSTSLPVPEAAVGEDREITTAPDRWGVRGEGPYTSNVRVLGTSRGLLRPKERTALMPLVRRPVERVVAGRGG